MGLRWFKKGFFPVFVGISVGFMLSFTLRSLSSCIEKRDVISPVEDILLSFSAANKNGEKGLTYQLVDPIESRELKVPLSTIDATDAVRTKPDLVLIGIMTAHKFLHTRAVAVYDTWAKSANVKIIFFTGGEANRTEDSSYEVPLDPPAIPLIALPGVDDSYPPQKKSFMMLKYMYENYGDKFEWFLRGDDDVYMKTDKLSHFLRSLDSSQLYFIGQAGRGNRREKGTLNLAHDENFCMGGPGIIFSRATLAKMVPHVQECLQDMYSTHEDVEVGRCVHRFVGISCTWAFEMQAIFYHNSSGELAFTSFLKQREVHRAISLHPIKDYRHLYRLHAYFQGLKIQELLFETIQIHRDMLHIYSSKSGVDIHTGVFSPVDLKSHKICGLRPSLSKFRPRQISDILIWNLLGKSAYHSIDLINPKQRINEASKEALQDVIRELMDIINGFSKVRGRVIEFKELLYGYHRTNPLYGEDFVVDLLMTYKKYRGKKMTVPVRRHAYIQRAFAPLQMRRIMDDRLLKSVPSNAGYWESFQNTGHKTNIVMIVPLAGRFITFERFLQNFVFSCGSLTNRLKINIDKPTLPEFTLNLVVVYFGTDEEKTQLQLLVNSYRQNTSEPTNSFSSSVSCQIRVVQVDGEFSRGIALETGISQCNENDLLFLIDVDIVFSPDVVQRVLLNTVQGERVYFPIVFSEYDPKLFPEDIKNADNFEISNERGYWREYGFGIAAFYKSDFRTVGGFDTKIHGWGKEDVQLFDRFIHTNLTVFRAPDPELLHLYHSIKCDSKLSHSQHDMCLGTQANTLASAKTLMQLIFRNRKKSGKLQQISEFIF